MLPIDEENPSPRIFNFQGLNTVSGNYKGVVATLLQMFPDKFAEWQQGVKEKEYKKQNPNQDPVKGTKASAPRDFGEIASQKDW